MEQYVTFRTAKLLKEKGFPQNIDNVFCILHYFKGSHYEIDGKIQECDEDVAIPTQSVCLRWLREKHNLCVEPYRTACGYLYTISRIPTGSEIYFDEYSGDDKYSGQWTTWEKAIEASIKYCLENFVK